MSNQEASAAAMACWDRDRGVLHQETLVDHSENQALRPSDMENRGRVPEGGRGTIQASFY